MTSKVNQVIPIPYLVIVISLIPVLLIANLLPAHATTDTYLLIDNFLSQHLFGLVGFWSSLFPFSSKLTTNYISLFGPFFAAIALYRTCKTMVVDPEQYKNLTLNKYLFALMVLLVFLAMFVSMNYLEAIDLVQHNRRFRIFGLNTVMYSLFASVVLLSFYALALWLYFALLYIPRLLIKRWRDRRA